MAVLTEIELRSRLKGKKRQEISELSFPIGTIITPSARSYLNEQKIAFTFENENEKITQDEEAEQTLQTKTKSQKENGLKKYRLYDSFIHEKPEYMTILHNNLLVTKDHKRIVFRGKVDTLESKIMEVQLTAFNKDLSLLVDDLQEVLDFVRIIAQCELNGKEVGGFMLLNMNPEEIKEESLHPEKYFGVEHFKLHYLMGEEIILLNRIRTLVRETEVLAYKAFKNKEGNPERVDIILALNRLSALFWIMMYKFRAGDYDV